MMLVGRQKYAVQYMRKRYMRRDTHPTRENVDKFQRKFGSQEKWE